MAGIITSVTSAPSGTDFLGERDRLRPAGRDHGLVAGVPQHAIDKPQHRLLVVHDEDRPLRLDGSIQRERSFRRRASSSADGARPGHCMVIRCTLRNIGDAVPSRRRYSARRLIPSTLAAAMRLPLTWRSTSTMCPRSMSCRAGSVGACRRDAVRRRRDERPDGPRTPSISRSVIGCPSASMHARSIDVLQLADVAVPGRVQQQPLGRRRSARQRLADPLRAVAHERRGQVRNVLAPIAQRRQRPARRRSGDRTGRRGSAGRDSARRSRLVAAIDADVDAAAAERPTRCTSPFSSARSSLACTASGSSPTSSRNSVPPSRRFEHARLRVDGAGERAAHVAEQLALEQRVDDRRAVDRDERLRRRGPVWWNARAASSLPVPVSPVMQHGLARAAPAAESG